MNQHHVILTHDGRTVTHVTACDRSVRYLRSGGDTCAPVKPAAVERTLARKNLCPECASTLRALHFTREQRAYAWLLTHVSTSTCRDLATASDDTHLGLLADDLAAVQREEFAEAEPGDFAEAFRVWLDRIGGERNLLPYARTLAAGEARRARLATRS